MIKVNRVYNSDKITNKISDNLKASEMRYLTFDFDILFLEDDVENAKVYFDVYYPDGSMKRSSNYNPLGHTGSYEFVGIDNAVGKINGVVGWGNSKESTYPAGTYCVDFIYKNVIIHSQKVIITK
ncbi:MAG TPA: hypothetical protein DCZ40_10995 [Lachnospiraceae bacterium]|nr:hypothetical protein [Lachnospiraceae bacterium]